MSTLHSSFSHKIRTFAPKLHESRLIPSVGNGKREWGFIYMKRRLLRFVLAVLKLRKLHRCMQNIATVDVLRVYIHLCTALNVSYSIGRTLWYSCTLLYTLRGASSLLVLIHRVMRRPQDVERVTGTLSTHFLYI